MHTTIWIKFENIMLSEKSHTHKALICTEGREYYMILYVWDVQRCRKLISACQKLERDGVDVTANLYDLQKVMVAQICEYTESH